MRVDTTILGGWVVARCRARPLPRLGARVPLRPRVRPPAPPPPPPPHKPALPRPPPPPQTFVYRKAKEALYPYVASYADPAYESVISSPYYKQLMQHLTPRVAAA